MVGGLEPRVRAVCEDARITGPPRATECCQTERNPPAPPNPHPQTRPRTHPPPPTPAHPHTRTQPPHRQGEGKGAHTARQLGSLHRCTHSPHTYLATPTAPVAASMAPLCARNLIAPTAGAPQRAKDARRGPRWPLCGEGGRAGCWHCVGRIPFTTRLGGLSARPAPTRRRHRASIPYTLGTHAPDLANQPECEQCVPRTAARTLPCRGPTCGP